MELLTRIPSGGAIAKHIVTGGVTGMPSVGFVEAKTPIGHLAPHQIK